jgi:phosphoribosylanthranilate isomerase
MALKTFVKVSNITNLSDARYCAGMEVDMLGFVCVTGKPDFVPINQFQDIRGWITGPAIVAEIEGLDARDLSAILENYKPDYLQVNYLLAQKITIDLPLIVRFELDINWDTLQSKRVSYCILTAEEFQTYKQTIPASVALIVEHIQDDLLQSFIEGKIGIGLSGSDEISPGFKDFDSLANILEQLEVD